MSGPTTGRNTGSACSRITSTTPTRSTPRRRESSSGELRSTADGPLTEHDFRADADPADEHWPWRKAPGVESGETLDTTLGAYRSYLADARRAWYVVVDGGVQRTDLQRQRRSTAYRTP